jgi:ankyrin repeat protein
MKNSLLLILLSISHIASGWTPEFQKCPPYKDGIGTWVGKNYNQALETVMPFSRPRSLREGEWRLDVRITPSFFDELHFTFKNNWNGNIEAVGVAPAENSISIQLEHLKTTYPNQELDDLSQLLKVKRWQKTLPPSSEIENKIKFLQEFRLPPQSEHLICLDGTGYEIFVQEGSRTNKLEIGCTEGDQEVLKIVNDLRDTLFGFKKIDYDLLNALRKKQIAKAIELVQKGANPELFTDEGEGSWLSSVAIGNPELVKLILQKKPDLVRKDFPLSSAASAGRHKLISLLVRSGADINEIHPHNAETPLIAASGFIKEGLEVIGATPSDYESVVKELIKAGADLNRKDNGGQTALIAATSRRHQTIARDLIEAGADLNAFDNCGNTALMEAAKNGDQLIVETLLRSGANKKLINAEGKTAMDYAIEKGSEEVIRLLN